MIFPCYSPQPDSGRIPGSRKPFAAMLVLALGVRFVLMIPRIAWSQPAAPAQDETLDAKRKSLIIDSVAVALDSDYVFPDVAKKMVNPLREKQEKDAYKDLISALRFTETLTGDLYQISRDKHLQVGFGPQLANRLREPDSLSRED